jgi:two-component system, cell cycle sensor histidine kinase and response regulator CckA
MPLMKVYKNIGGYFRQFQAFVINRMVPPDITEKDSLTYWRVRILFAILSGGLMLCVFALILSITLVIRERLWGLGVFNVCAYVIATTLLFSNRIRYEIRATVTLFLLYATGVAIILLVGPLSGGPMWLFAFAVLVGVLLGSRAAVTALCVNAITLTIIGWLIYTGKIGHAFPFFSSFERMVAAGVNFIVLNGVAAISVAALVKGLVSTHQKERVLTRSLEREQAHLIEAKNKLEYEAEERKREIEERRNAEAALRESEERFRNLANSLPQVVFETDENGTLNFANQNAFELFGYSEKEIEKGLNVLQMLIPDDRDRAAESILRVFAGESVGGIEYTAMKKDGGTFPLIAHANAIVRDDKPMGLRGIIIDLTERKKAEAEKEKLEAQLQRAQKMEALGTLAGGVAHDLNNILSGTVSYPELLLLEIPEDSPLRKPILTIHESGKKAAAIVQDLLTLARRGVVNPEVVNLNDIISKYLKSPEYEKLRAYHPGVEVKTHLEENLYNLSGSPVHLTKTIMNLVSNAAEAMTAGGSIRISSENRYVDRPINGYEDVAKGEYVTLTVADTGIGISSEDIGRIFEPFYTKKKMGRSGTGLGMAVVWGTVKDHNGYIDVQSTEGEGTTFTLHFPATRKQSSQDESILSIQDYMGEGESILIVDDVKEQREIASSILKKLGYVPHSVSSGEEAVEYAKKNSPDLLILDMIMNPGMDGFETYRKILELHPGQRAIIASGYSETARVKDARKLGAGAYVKKPYSLEEIGLTVRAQLDK